MDYERYCLAKIILLLILLPIILSGCDMLPFADVLFPTEEISEKQQTEDLYIDDFSDPNSGWDRMRSDEGFTDYEEGTYQIYVNEPTTDYFSTPYCSYKDVGLEVQAVRSGGPVENNFGLVCRFSDERNFYLGQVSSDGYFGIFKVRDGEYLQLDNEYMRLYEVILSEVNEVNLLRFDCQGQKLFLFVNGTLLASVEDDDYSIGDIGLLAGTFEQPGVLIAFDNFRILQPGETE